MGSYVIVSVAAQSKIQPEQFGLHIRPTCLFKFVGEEFGCWDPFVLDKGTGIRVLWCASLYKALKKEKSLTLPSFS